VSNNNWISDKACLKKNVRSIFQPNISLRDGSVLGYEALSRGPEGSELKNPEHMFAVARQCGMIWNSECVCRDKSLCAISKLEPKCKIFLNIDPCVIADRRFRRGFTKKYLIKYHIPQQDIIFEITEKNPIQNIGNFEKIINKQ
jgi:EAL domain-containing protein (putative c-di-GMP-specific phosphodiesterase class I)